MPFEKHLPSTDINRLLVTSNFADNPKQELMRLDSDAGVDDHEIEEAFEKVAANEKERIKGNIEGRVTEYEAQLGLPLYEERIDLIAHQTLKSLSDINSALLDFKEMHAQIAVQNESLFSQVGMDVRLGDSAIDEIIRIAIDQDREIGEICLSLANELEYGLRLVKDRIGCESFALTKEAVVDPEKYIESLIKKCYSQDPLIS
jgi:hypothetical protein